MKFQEKRLTNCEDPVEIHLHEPKEQLPKAENGGKHDQEDSKDRIISETKNEDEKKSPNMNLQNRSELKHPKSFEVYVMASEVFMSDVNKPESYEECINCKGHNFWKAAIDSAIISLNENNTWTLTPLPRKAKALPCKLVFWIKNSMAPCADK